MEKSQYERRLGLLYVLEYLDKYSDSEHPVTEAKIMEYLSERSITCARKSVYDDIGALCEYGFDITRAYAAKEGFFLGERAFETAQVRLLLDAILSARFITEKKTKELSRRLMRFLSGYQAQDIDSQIFIDNRLKFQNEQIYYIIDTINRAIAQEKKVRFDYCRYHIEDNRAVLRTERTFEISPYALVWSNDFYYLVGNYEKYDNLSNYRLDRMRMAQLTDKKIRPHQQVSGYAGAFDTADYVRKNMMMYPGLQEEIELLCKNSLLDVVLDRFGTDAQVINKEKGRFLLRAGVYISDGLVDWLLPYSDRLYVMRPRSLREQVEEKIISLSASPQEKGLL